MASRDASGTFEGYEIFLKYLPTETTADAIRDFFKPAGEIIGDARLMMHPQTGKCKGIGWITFATADGLAEALRWDGCAYGGRHLSVTKGKQQHSGFRPSLQAPGTHTPALCREVVAKMVGQDVNGTFIDATFGRGGHSRAILAALGPAGKLHAFDMDPEAIKEAKALASEDKRFTIHHAPFSSIERVLSKHHAASSSSSPIAGAFFDLGISSPQFDEAHRGFRPEADGPLDLRFDQTKGVPAWQFLQQAERSEIIRVIAEYGETTDAVAARRIADAICLARSRNTLPTRTKEFASLVADAKGREYQPMHPAKLTFQALRIHLNDEFGEMRAGMRAAFNVLSDGGRIGLITWKHSECQIVIDVFRPLEACRAESPLMKWYNEQQPRGQGSNHTTAALLPNGASLPRDTHSLVMDEVTRPSDAELSTNSRSRSALLHILRKKRAPRLADLEALAYPALGWPSVADAAANGAAGGGSEEDDAALSKAERKARKAERRAAEAAASGGLGEAEKAAAARRNREEKKAAKKRRRAEAMGAE